MKREPNLQVVKQEPNLQNVKQEPGGNLQDVKQEPKLNAQVKQEEEEDDEDEDEDMEMSEYTEYEIDSEEDGEDAHSSSGDSDFHDVVNDVVHDVAASTTTAKEEERDDGSGFSADVSDAADLVDPPGQNLQAAPAARKIKCVKCGVFTGTGMLFCARCWREHQEGIPVNSKPMRHLKVREATTDRKAAGPSDPCQKSGEAGPSGLCQESHESGNVASPAADAARTVAVKRLRTGDDCDDDGKRHRLQEQSTLGGDEIYTERTAASKEEAKLMCNFCLRREKDGGIVHGGIVHQICCYPCAKRLVKRRQPCPVCRRRIEKISKIIGA